LFTCTADPYTALLWPRQSLACHREGRDSVPRQYPWDLWWAKWY